MYKKFTPSQTLPSGSVAFLQVESISDVDVNIHQLYPRLAEQQNRGRAPKANSPRIVPNLFRPQVLASE
jgi:hypothetical protein